MEQKKQYRAGVIPFYVEDSTVYMMFMKPTKYIDDEQHKFQIAKGKVDPGESMEKAAFREAKEELGLLLGNVKQKIDIGVFLGRTHVYLAEVKDKDMFNMPTDETEDVAWMTFDEFKLIGRELHVPVVKVALKTIVDEVVNHAA
jgi:8-oxo-dGTP pyrophosphatase MutT (NUDIX family)